MGKRRDVKRKRMSVIGIVYVITPAWEGNDSIELCGEARGYEATAKGRDRDNGNVSGAEVLGRSVYESARGQEGKRSFIDKEIMLYLVKCLTHVNNHYAGVKLSVCGHHVISSTRATVVVWKIAYR